MFLLQIPEEKNIEKLLQIMSSCDKIQSEYLVNFWLLKKGKAERDRRVCEGSFSVAFALKRRKK